MNHYCIACGGDIPDERRRDSRYCSADCRRNYRKAYFAAGSQTYPPGSYLLFLRAPSVGLVLVSWTRALRTRIRTAAASCAEPLTVLGIVPADKGRADRFKEAFAPARVRGSWYSPTPELLAYVARRARRQWSPYRPLSLDPDAAVEEAA